VGGRPAGLGHAVFGGVCSWIGYQLTSGAGACPTSKVVDVCYVNPCCGLSGWLILHERVDRFILAGSAIVVLSSSGTSAKVKTKTVAEKCLWSKPPETEGLELLDLHCQLRQRLWRGLILRIGALSHVGPLRSADGMSFRAEAVTLPLSWWLCA